MRFTFISCLLATVFANEYAAYETIQATEGFLVGALGGKYPNLDLCISNGTDIVKDIEDAVNFLGKKDVTFVNSGLLKIGDALTKIQSGVKTCQSIGNDTAKIKKMATFFR